jgi:hypothetical protein
VASDHTFPHSVSQSARLMGSGNHIFTVPPSYVSGHFPHPSRPALGPIQPPVWWVPCLLSEGKAAGVCFSNPNPFIAEVKERVELYLYFPSGPSWPVVGRNWSLPLLQSYRIAWEGHFTNHIKYCTALSQQARFSLKCTAVFSTSCVDVCTTYNQTIRSPSVR